MSVIFNPNFTTAQETKLAGIEAGAEVNVNADWNAVSGDAQILNKPTLGTAAATNSTAYATAAQGAKADTAVQPAALASYLSLNASGGLQTLNTIGVGNATPSTSGAGITFPATQNASSNANTLDDYEEGTWTPTDASGAGLSFSTALGWYTKVGRVVHAHFSVVYPSTASGSRAAIGGLPFTVQNSTLANFGGALGYTDTSLVLGCHLDPGLASLNFYRNDGQNADNWQFSLKSVRIVVTYFATA